MNQPAWVIEKYVTDNGACPFDEWTAMLDSKTKTRIDFRLERLCLGNFGDHKPVGEGVYELRFFFGAGYRIYYAAVDGRIVLLLTGGSKKKQSKDIKEAQRFWNRYNSR